MGIAGKLVEVFIDLWEHQRVCCETHLIPVAKNKNKKRDALLKIDEAFGQGWTSLFSC